MDDFEHATNVSRSYYKMSRRETAFRSFGLHSRKLAETAPIHEGYRSQVQDNVRVSVGWFQEVC